MSLDAERLGLVMIHQELNLVPGLTVAENIFLGHEPTAVGLIAERLAHHLRHVFAHRLAQLLHQLCDFLIGGAVLNGVLEALLCAGETFGGVRKVAVFKSNRRLPEEIDDGFRLLFQTPVFERIAEAAHRHAGGEIGGGVVEDLVRLDHHRFEHVQNTRRGIAK